VENRLAELWALLDLTTPGLLGGFTGFRRDYAAPIERWQDPDATRRLRLLTGPFVLRRTKADPTIAPELPPKTELTVAASSPVSRRASTRRPSTTPSRPTSARASSGGAGC
jgi:SNF2 family DNA or RNA helicase